MPRFVNNETQKLKEFLYNSYAHDAKLESIRYERRESSLKIEAFNPIFNVKLSFTFYDVKIAFAIRGNYFGSRETIISLTAEEDFSYLQNYIPKYSENIKDSLYLLFQMFSGDELHIVSSEVIIEIAK